MNPIFASFLLAAAPAAALFASETEVRRRESVPYFEVPGVTHHPLQTLDITAPAGAKATGRPIAFLIHGGAWAFGDKGAAFAQPKTDWFLRRGFVVVSANYRLSPQVKHPAHITDIARALAWVRAHAGEFGGDPDKIVLLGHSAGAHLAALATVDHDRLSAAGVPAESLKGVILLDGAGYDIPYQMSEAGPWLRRRYREAFGPSASTQRDASPALRVKAGRSYPPFLIFHTPSREDAKHQSEALADALRQAGGSAVVIAAQRGESHLSINREFGEETDPETLRAESELRSWGLLRDTPPAKGVR